MANIKQAFGASTAITITLASLADGNARKSAAVDNGTDKFLDVLFKVVVQLATGTPVSDQAINIYLAGSEDGTDYTDNYTDGDAALTLRSPTNLKLVEIIEIPDSGALTYPSHPISVAKAFGGVMPRKWGIIVENKTGLAFGSTEGNHIKEYSGIFATSI